MSARLDAALAEFTAALREEIAAQLMPPDAAPEQLLDVRAAARALSCGRSLIYSEIGRGRLSSLHVGRRRLIPVSSIRAYVALLKDEAS